LDLAKSTLARKHPALEARLDVSATGSMIAGQFIRNNQLDNDIAADSKRRRTSARPAPISPRRSSTTGGRSHLASLGIAGIASCRSGSLVSTSTVMTTVSQVDPIKAEFNVSELEYMTSAKGNQWARPAQGDDPVLS